MAGPVAAAAGAGSAGTGSAGTGRVSHEVSAGGLVVRGADGSSCQAALIGRRDRRGRLCWSLPKGHIEAGETAEQAAVREVREETGISGRVVAPLGSVAFWFNAGGARVRKTVHHFLLTAMSGRLDDGDPEVDRVAWVRLSELADVLAHAGERDLVRDTGAVLRLLG